MLELVNSDQFTRRAGLRPRPPYSRIIVLELLTGSGSNQTDEVSSAVLASRGLLLSLHIHVHHGAVNQAGSGSLWFGFNQQELIGPDGGVTFRQSIIQTYGSFPDGVTLLGVDLDYDFDMGVQFSGDKTRLSAACRTFNNFTTTMQLIFQIAEG